MTCDRCTKDTVSTILSMFNDENLCVACKETERKRPDYRQAEVRNLMEYAGRLRDVGRHTQARNVETLAAGLLEDG